MIEALDPSSLLLEESRLYQDSLLQHTLTLGGGGIMKTMSSQNREKFVNKYSESMLEEASDEDLDEKTPQQRSTPGSNMLSKNRSRTAAG